MNEQNRERSKLLSHPIYSLLTLGACVLLVTISLIFSPHVGLQNDEALFGAGIYSPRGDLQSVKVLDRQVPIMIMSYIGGVKSILYKPLFTVFGTSLLVIRLPMILLAAVSVWLFFRILTQVSSPLIGCLGAFLLATDPIFLLCTTFDWGPVAIQIVLFLLGIYLLMRYVETRRLFPLAFASFLWGVALWNKATFLWSLCAFLLAFGMVYANGIRKHLTAKVALFALTAFVAGASPLIFYNLNKKGQTLTENVGFDTTQIPRKLLVLNSVLDGSSLFEYITRSSGTTNAQTIDRIPASVKIANFAKWPRQTIVRWTFFGCLIVVLPVLLLSGNPFTKPLLLSLFYFIFSAMVMIFTSGAGDSAHHFVLLDPAPQAFILLCIAGMVQAFRIFHASLPVLLGIILCLSNLLILNSYLGMLKVNGPTVQWTDAIFALEKKTRSMSSSRFVVMDWGILASLRLLAKGQLYLLMGSDALMTDRPSKEQLKIMTGLLRNKNSVFIGHTPGNELFTGVTARLDRLLARKRMKRIPIDTVPDSHGRPIFELFRVQRYDPTENTTDTVSGGNNRPLRGVFYYQPRAAHWWFWENFDRQLYLQDLKKIRRGHIDTITFDIQIKDFVLPDNLKAPVRFNPKTVDDFRFALENAHRHGYKVLLILWYVNGYSDPATSGGARLIHQPAFEAYKQATIKMAELTRGYPVTFFFTNELLDLHAGFDNVQQKWILLPFPPAQKAFVAWSRSTFGSLEEFNRQTAKSFSSWERVDIHQMFAQRTYWNWFAGIIRQRLPEIVAAVKQGNPIAKVGYEDYTYVYGWGDSGIPETCDLDYAGFGIYRTMVTSSPKLADDAYRRISAKCPEAQIFIPEVGMDTENSTEKEQAEWYESILKWARKKEVGINILMWRDFEVSGQTDSAQAFYGLYRKDGTPKPVVEVLKKIRPVPDSEN